MVRKYTLNQAGEHIDVFPWVQEFEAWAQRTHTTVNWSYTEHPNTSALWAATASFGAHKMTGYGQTRKEAKKDAVIRIERAGILHI
ncbi:unnamed protein product [Rhizoctonia solani]|uniref:Uncharacterized protein n=1 Tax=Rhizoctonia solani TaxID=456999 RepID=A0A8H3CXT9_9AGAM|nr:unnamed protein product [Rhizoctonia solani]